MSPQKTILTQDRDILGLSFDLTVEELPPLILDQAWAYHAFMDGAEGCAIGYGEASPFNPNSSALLTGEGSIDMVSAGRWAGIQPVPGSWVINKIMCANGTVFLCGNYRCKLNYDQWSVNLWDRTLNLSFDLSDLDAAWQDPQVQFNGFLDGFFAACRYDEIDNPAAWHILPTRSQLELPESEGPADNDPYFTNGEPIPQANNQQGGLMDMCVDNRSFNTFVREGWSAMEPEIYGSPQPLVIQCVGYMPCLGYGTTLQNSSFVTEGGYKRSLYTEQDFIPIMYSFVVNIFNDQYSGNDSADIYKTINPQYINSQLTSANSGIGGFETEEVYRHWNYNWCIGDSNLEGMNPQIPYGYGQPDQCGTGMATFGAFSGIPAGTAQGAFQSTFFGPNNLRIPWSSCAARYGSLQIYPFEQVTFRAHQIGITETKFTGNPFYPSASTLSSFTYENTCPRQPSTFSFCPTPMIGQFPIRKPMEMVFATPNFLGCKSRYQDTGNPDDGYPNTGRCEWAPQPNFYTNLMPAEQTVSAITDGEIWRHGFIPRQLTGITNSFNTFAGSAGFLGPQGLYYPTYEISQPFPDLNNPSSLGVGSFDPTSLISYLVITGNCLEDPTTDPALTYSCKTSGGKPIYSPLCVLANTGQSVAGVGALGDYAPARLKALPADNANWIVGDQPPQVGIANNTWFKCYTRRNISVEDVNTENACNLFVAPTNTSLDNASFVKPLPVVRADYPAENNQVFNVGLLLQSNELVGGTDEKRAEIYILQPWLGIDAASGISFDTKTIVPYITYFGWAEATIAEKMVVTTTCEPNTSQPNWTTETYLDSALLPSEWISTQTQGVPLTTEQVEYQKSCFHTYVEPTPYQYGDPVGLGQTLLGYWKNRVVGGLGWKPFQAGHPNFNGPTVHVQDPGNISLDVNAVINSWTAIAQAPVWGGVYRLTVPYNGYLQDVGTTTTSPDIYDSWDNRMTAVAPATAIPVPQQYLSLPTTNTTKVGNSITGNLFNDVAGQGAGFSYDIAINKSQLGVSGGAPPGATLPFGTGQYTTLTTLVNDINTSLDSYRSAGNPYDLPYSKFNNPGVSSEFGLKDISCYATSDGSAIYFRDINQTTHPTVNLSLGPLFIRSNNNAAIDAAGAEYYPWNTDGGLPYQYVVMASNGPVGFNNISGQSTWGCAAVVEEPSYNAISFNIKNYGNTFNKECPGGATTTRRPVCADFDLDRAQWMVTLADNDKAISEQGNGFSAISTTPDFSELLDQTKNFGNVPDFYNLAVNNFNTGASSVYASSLWAARQGSPNLDGIVWIGMADYNTTETYPSAVGIQDTSLSYVWANYWCDDPAFPVPPSIANPYNGGASWQEAQYMPYLTYQGAAFPFCYIGNNAYQIKGTTGRTVQVWLNYVLYDEIDSIIAVECQNLGLRVTPENVEWYKRKILKQDSAEMTLEEIEEWMSKQRAEYQDILKERNRGWKMRKRREEAGTLKPSATETLEQQLAGDFYALDEQSIEELLPQLNILPPNPDTDEMMDVDAFGNTTSGDIQKTEEKRRNSEN